MKIRLPVKLLATALLSLWLVNGCADQAMKNPDSKANPAAMAAIANASDAIKLAKANNWIWVNTEDFLAQAQEAADKGDNDTAIVLAGKAQFEAEAAVTQYNYEKTHPRGI
jgi:pectate lyase